MRENKNFLIVISAPSGAGKTTLCQKLLTDFPHIVLSVSATTRAPRGKEKDGSDYFFLTPEEFKDKIKTHAFAEWAQVHDQYYGTLKSTIESAFQHQKSILLDIDVQGAIQIKKSYPHQTLLIFILPPNMIELERRLRLRATDSENTIQKRIKNAQSEIDQSHLFDYAITNNELEKAYNELKDILKRYIVLENNSNDGH